MAEWNMIMEPYLGMNWLDTPWLYSEFYAYRRVVEAFAFFKTGTPPAVPSAALGISLRSLSGVVSCVSIGFLRHARLAICMGLEDGWTWQSNPGYLSGSTTGPFLTCSPGSAPRDTVPGMLPLCADATTIIRLSMEPSFMPSLFHYVVPGSD